MTNLDTVIHNLRKELEELERINAMMKYEKHTKHRERIGKDLDLLDFDVADSEVRATAWEQDDIVHSKYYYDYDRNL
mgnify:CR=1 FL=1|tara:strand:+ start:313 stop:543 length:231 start_codon:yes stop_codon:yes gene_type:complete